MLNYKLNSIMLVLSGSLTTNAIAAEKTEQTERIVIQGTKQELTLQEVDASVELFTKERLSAEHIVDISDALIRIPNVSSIGRSNNINIRGIGRTGSTNTGQGVTSNVYVDGSPLSGTALSRGVTSLWDSQQVEVLRGSQSSIQGRNALAGAIVISTADPTFSPEGKVRLSYAENNTYQIAGAYGNAIIDNELAFRVAADIQQSDGLIDNLYFDDNTDKQERLLLRAKLLFTPESIDNLTVKLTIDHNDIKIGNSGATSVKTNFPFTSEEFKTFSPFDYIDYGDYPRNDLQTTRLILDTYYALSDHWSIKNIITHEKTSSNREFGDIGRISTFDLYANNDFSDDITSAELRFTFDYDTISGVIGGYYFTGEDSDSVYNEVLLSPIVIERTLGFGSVSPADTATLINTTYTSTDTENMAIFAQVRIDLNEQFTLDLGLRYDNEEFDNTGAINAGRVITPNECAATVPGALINLPIDQLTIPCETLVNLSLGDIADDIPQTAKYTAWLPKATLTYKIDDEHSLFGSAQRGYRAGGSYLTLIDNPNGDGTVKTVSTYDPEYLSTIEFGSRSIFSGGDITFNTNFFYSKYTDQQVNLPGKNLQNPEDDLIVNAAESTIYGLEVYFEYLISQEWDVYASLGLLNAKFDDFPYAEVGQYSNLSGNKLPSSPEKSASIGVNWKDDGWFANVSAYYSSSRFSSVENLNYNDIKDLAINSGISESLASNLTEEVDAYINLNARFGYETGNVTIYAFSTNLLNEEVVTDIDTAGVDQITGEITLRHSSSQFTILPPRTFGIGLDYSF